MAQLGTGNYTYELIRDFLKLPDGETFGLVSRVATDSQDRVYVFQRKDPPVVVFDRDGKLPGRLGHRRGHRPARPEDRRRRRLHHRPLRLGREVVHAGRQTPAGARPARRAFRHRLHRLPLARRTRGGAVQSPHRDDGPPQRRHLRDRRLPQRPRAPLHARRPARQVMGRAGQGARASSTCRTASRSTPTASSTSPTGRTSASRCSRPTATSSASGPAWAGRTTSRAARTASTTSPSRKTAAIPRMSACAMRQGNVLARMESRHVHGVGVDSRGDIYAGLTLDRSVDKFVRTG